MNQRGSLAPFAAILVAAGRSARFGDGDKLNARIGAKSVIEHAAAPLLTLDFGAVIIVSGDNNDMVRALFSDARVTHIVNRTGGMGASIAAGARAVAPDARGVFICLGDMPLVSCGVYRALAQALEADPYAGAVAPFHEGQRGHPVLFGGSSLGALQALRGDDGARSVLRQGGFRLAKVPADDDVLFDIDTQADLTEARRCMAARDPT